MKVRIICILLLCLTLSSACFAAAPGYHAGKIVKVEKLDSPAMSAGTDAPAKSEVSAYRVSIQLGSKIYVCSYDTHSDHDISWIEGKDVEARVGGKTLYVKKPNGKEAKGTILSTSSAGNQ